jgi:hypothetical protein
MLAGLTIATSRYCKGFAILRLSSIALFFIPHCARLLPMFKVPTCQLDGFFLK